MFGLLIPLLYLWGPVSSDELGPISVCTYEGEHIADKASCTRYYQCRNDDLGMFVTDLLVCPDGSVFDMVTSLCNETTTNYWQDPTSCTKFYGCHSTKETSEGFIRQQYWCPGDLRFHPMDRFCTFKTKVPDILCNSRADEQAIIGTDSMYLRTRTSNPAISLTTKGHIRGRPFRTSSRSGFRTSPAEVAMETTVPDDAEDQYSSPRTLKTMSDVSKVALAIKQQLMNAPYAGQVPSSVVTHAELEAPEDREAKEEN